MSILNKQSFRTEIFRSDGKKFKRVYSSSLPEGESLKLRMYVSRICGSFGFSLCLINDADGTHSVIDCVWTSLDAGYDVYEAKIKFTSVGLYFLYGIYSDTEGRSDFLFPDGSTSLPITVYSRNFTTPDRFKGGVIYQIFPDRFAKSDFHQITEKADTRINPDWENGIPDFPEKPGDSFDNNMFFGGNLYGVAEKLDHLSSLGVNILYLNPIFEAHTNHKYDTSDYMKVDSMFGGEKALDDLISECKKRGIKIILDGVFNHTGDDSIYFNKYGHFPSVGAYQSKTSPYFPWYEFSSYPDEYNCWWGVKILPSIKKDCKEFRQFVNGEKGVVRHYLKKGIDGWRLDVADELSDSFLTSLRSAAKAENQDSLIIGEVWEDASDKIAYGSRRRYFQGEQLDSVMNYPLRKAIIDYIISGSAEIIASTAVSLYLHYPEFVSDVQMNILGTHDTERILSVLACDGIENFSNAELSRYRMSQEARMRAVTYLKMASFLQFTLPGIPSIYYGDEAGMEGGRDPFNRMPFPWGKEDKQILHHYRMLGALRASERSLANGNFRVENASEGLFVYRRGEIICAVNRGDEKTLQTDAPLLDLLYGRRSHRSQSGYVFTLAHNDFGIFSVQS